MITCRSLGIPIPSALNIARNNAINAQSSDQPMALLKVNIRVFRFSSRLLKKIVYNRMKVNERKHRGEGNNPVQVGHRLKIPLIQNHPVPTKKYCMAVQINRIFPLPNHRGQIILMKDQRLVYSLIA